MKSDRLGGIKTLNVTGFLDEFEKDDVKREVDIINLFSFFGVKLTKRGKSYMGLCPFHEDHNPSLSVDRDKGLYNCFGCGESGDIFDLTMKMKEIGFKEALIFLKEYLNNGHGKPITGSYAAVSADSKKTKEGLMPAKKALSQLSLDMISEYYRKNLLNRKEALDYLKSRGFTDYTLYNRFKIGFCDGSLVSLVSEKQREELKAAGILSESSKEHFSGCITFPLFDDTGKVVSFYGRRVDNNRVKHLYSTGPHLGIVNRKAASVYREEIILCESVLDALSLIQMGIENVIPCYGVNGFTDEHLKLLKDKMVRLIVIGFDSDEAGEKASTKLKEKLLIEGFKVKVITVPVHKDWNDYLLSAGSKDSIDEIIKHAEVFQYKEPAKEPHRYEKKGSKYIFTFNEVTYRVLGVKKMFVSSLKVNIRAEKGDEKYIDNVELYSARSRSLFSSMLSEVLSLEALHIEKHLLEIVEYLEAERDLMFEEREEKIHELTEEERHLGMGLLTDVNIFDRIVGDIETLGYVGESVNKQLLYLAASSRKLPDPISVIIVSRSSAGKSYLIDTVKKLIPLEDVVSVTSLSDQALNYLPKEGLLHKFLVMGEAVHSEIIEHQLREMLSNHELSRLVTMKDVKSGVMSSRIIRKDVIVSLVMSSTDNNINPENASRSFIINTDESETQTKNIHAQQRNKYTLEQYDKKENLIPLIIKTHHAAQRLLKMRIIVNPFVHFIDFPSSLMRSRRDNERFIDLIAAVCFLRQFQKEEKVQKQNKTGESIHYIECDIRDYEIAYNIMRNILPSTLTNFPKSAIELYSRMRKIIRKKANEQGLKAVEVSVTQRELRELTGMSQMYVKRNMRILSDYEYIIASSSARQRSRKSYRLLADEAINLIDLSMIPAPDEIIKRMNLQNV